MIYEVVRDFLCTKSGMVLGIIQDMQIVDGEARITYLTRTMQEMVNYVPVDMIQVA